MTVIIDKVQFKRGPESRVPHLDIGEPLVTKDTEKFIIGFPSGNVEIAKQSAVDAHTSQLASIMYNVKNFGAKGDGVADDTTAIQNALNTLLANGGGTLYFPNGTYKYSTFSIDKTNNPSYKPVTIQGAGMGATILKPSGDGITIQSYLVHLKDLLISGTNTGTNVGIRGIPTSETGDAVIGRTHLERVQVSNFYNGLDIKHFDQLWIDKSFFSYNLNDGIYIHPEAGAALVNIQDTVSNWNGRHGVYVYTSSIIGMIKMGNQECVQNGGNGVRLEGASSNTIVSVLLDNLDIELVSGTSNTALYLKNVWKFNIRGGAYTPAPGQTIFSSITLDNCREGFVLNPWWRAGDLGDNTAVTNYLYVTNSAKQIYLQGSEYFGTPIDFSVDTATTDPAACINLDLLATGRILQEFIPASQMYSIQGTPAPVLTSSGGNNVWKFDVKSNVTVPQDVAITIKPYLRKVKSVTIWWWNDSTNSGNVVWQLGLNSYTTAQVNPSITYVSGISSANGQKILTKVTINTPTWIASDLASLQVIRNATDVNDTLNGLADLVGVQLNFQ